MRVAGLSAFQGVMAQELATPARNRTALERLDKQLGQDKREALLQALADAIDIGGTTWLQLDGPPGQVRSNRLLKGAPLW